jgi:hypothetical protein
MVPLSLRVLLIPSISVFLAAPETSPPHLLLFLILAAYLKAWLKKWLLVKCEKLFVYISLLFISQLMIIQTRIIFNRF